MKTKTVYVADDGTEFASEEEVSLYEKSLSTSQDVEAYIVAHQIAKPTAGMLRKQIPAYLLWLDGRNAAEETAAG